MGTREPESAVIAERTSVAIFLSLSGRGGVERMVLTLADAMAAQGHAVDVLVARARADIEVVPLAHARLRKLRANHTLASVPELVAYLRANRPAALLAAKDRAGRAAALANQLAGRPTRVFVRLGTHLTAALADRSRWTRWARLAPMPVWYRLVDGVIAVSEGVREDAERTTRLPAQRIATAPNPVIPSDLEARARAPVSHPWCQQTRAHPLVLGVGRLTAQKDFLTLIQAFAELARRDPRPRLMILGEGQDRPHLERAVASHGLAERVALPGSVADPFPYLARAQLFVLSSRWEGSPNVLTEALAVGTPAVSTDCPSGPRQLLADGRIGRLVPVGAPEALAAAMAQTLAAPVRSETLRQAVAEYTVANSCARYLALMGLS